MIFSCILQNWYEKLDDAYINGDLRQVMFIGASKCSNWNSDLHVRELNSIYMLGLVMDSSRTIIFLLKKYIII